MSAAKAVAPRTLGSTYVPLFNVRFQHAYYNAANGACRDFTVAPTPETAQLMAGLGMVFKDLGAGFSVLIDQARIPQLLSYLGIHYQAGPQGEGYWSRLTFLLASRNPDLLGITQLPLDTSPLAQSLYTNNIAATAVRGTLMLGGAAGPGKAALYPVAGASVTVFTPQGTTSTLRDVSGAAVPVATSSTVSTTGYAMSGVPWGFYTVTVEGEGGPTSYVNLPATPPTFCLLDLLLTQPTPGQGDPSAYPIAPMAPPSSGVPAAAPQVAAVDLVLPFGARKTFWNYYICSQDRAAKFAPGLQITGKGTIFDKSFETLPNGDSAVLFTAQTALPLQQVSQYRFQLSGQRNGANGSRDDISVAWLPAAPATPVWPAPSGDALAGSSEIYVYV